MDGWLIDMEGLRNSSLVSILVLNGWLVNTELGKWKDTIKQFVSILVLNGWLVNFYD